MRVLPIFISIFAGCNVFFIVGQVRQLYYRANIQRAAFVAARRVETYYGPLNQAECARTHPAECVLELLHRPNADLQSED